MDLQKRIPTKIENRETNKIFIKRKKEYSMFGDKWVNSERERVSELLSCTLVAV